MTNSILILWFWCCMLCMLFENVVPSENVSNSVNSVNVKSVVNEDTMFFEGSSISSSYIKSVVADRFISKIYVYVADTFYVDEDLKLNGIAELQIFANTWNITRPVTFDLSGLNGASQKSTLAKGSAGNPGSKGMDGGNIFALANILINGNNLTVISDGGNGGDGQDGSASDDVFVLFSGENGVGDSGWFSQGDLHSYYKKYFNDKGYDTDISDIDDYTSLYAVFVHKKKSSFNIRLNPRKCCGKTGVGGTGGTGGHRGHVIFKYVGNKRPVTTPNVIVNDGSAGKRGQNAKTCETVSLDVRADAELNKIVFFFPPLHHSFSTQFTVLNHTNYSNCSAEYAESTKTIGLDSKRNEIDIASAVIRYKRFLLENMKNDSLTTTILSTYRAIDNNREISSQYSLKTYIMEANELEKKFPELKENSIDLLPLYRRLSNKIDRFNVKRRNEDEQLRSNLVRILWNKLSDLRAEYILIPDLKVYIQKVALVEIEDRNNETSLIWNTDDAELLSIYNQLRYRVDANLFLAIHKHVIEGFKLTYFPFAAEYLDMYDIPNTFMDDKDLDTLSGLVTYNLKSLIQNIDTINFVNKGNVIYVNGMDKANPESAFFIWKNSDVRDKIRKLFTGKKITLLADVKQSNNRYSAIKFKTIDLVFRSTDQSITDSLRKILESYELHINHTGRSAMRCNNNFYEVNSDPTYIMSSFLKNESEYPYVRNFFFEMLRNERATLSPYALWEFSIKGLDQSVEKFHELEPFAEFVDMELHGTGEYLWESESICKNEDLPKFYTQI